MQRAHEPGGPFSGSSTNPQFPHATYDLAFATTPMSRLAGMSVHIRVTAFPPYDYRSLGMGGQELADGHMQSARTIFVIMGVWEVPWTIFG